MELDYDINKPWLTLDDWQKDYIAEDGNCFLLCGRQSGKTTAMSIKIAEKAVNEKKACDYLVVAFTERQAYALFFKTLTYLKARYPNMIKRGVDKPTMHEINLTNGVCIMCYACGQSGTGLRTYTLKRLFIDEGAPMNREIFTSISPMLSVAGGSMDIASTPRGKVGYFYECSKRDDFKKFYISAEDCPRHNKEFLESERKSMTKLAYAQEYLAHFLDDLRQFFPTELIKKCMTISRGFSDNTRTTLFPSGDLYLGVDCARLGEDQSVLLSVHKKKDRIEMIDMEILEKTLTTETAKRILIADQKYKYNKIYIDDGGVGAGIFDQLLYNDQTRGKVIAINNASKSLTKDDKKKRRLLKEDLYDNLLKLMEQGKVDLWDDDDLFLSLKSVQYEYNEQNQLKIYGNYTHITESLCRAVWCMTGKHLNLWVGWTNHGV